MGSEGCNGGDEVARKGSLLSPRAASLCGSEGFGGDRGRSNYTVITDSLCFWPPKLYDAKIETIELRSRYDRTLSELTIGSS